MNKFFRYLTIIFLLVFYSCVVQAQNDPLLRIEIDSKSDDANYKLASCKDKGLLLFYETTIEQDAYKFWVFVFYNKFLQESWKKDVPVYQNMNFQMKALHGDDMYVLFYIPDKKKSDSYNYQVLKISLADGHYEMFSGNLPAHSSFVDFNVLGKYVIVGMNRDNDRSGIYSLNTITKETQPVYEIDTDRSRIEELYMDTLSSSYFGIFNIQTSKSEYYFQMKAFDLDGNNSSTMLIQPGPGKKFNTGKIVRTGQNSFLLIGTYAVIKGNTVNQKNYFDDQASGFYSILISNNQEQEVRYYNFLDLENMTGYLKSKEYLQAKKKAEKQDETDKYSLNFELLLHNVISKDNLYYFIAEAYYEEYRTVTNTYYDYYGHPMPVSYSVFDGYKYFNAFVSCFDPQGVKIWDNGMEIFNILSFDLTNRISTFFPDSSQMVLTYNHDGKIAGKIIAGDKTIEGVEYYPVETTYANDKIMADSKSNMFYWYNNYFIAYGFQTIKNNSLANKSKRTVFYINKVAFQ